MNVKKILGFVGASALITATGGLAAPMLGVGLLSTVALAPIVTSSLSTIATIGVVKNINDAKRSKKENEALREELKKSNMDSKAKQKVIEKLNEQLEQVKAELREEKIKSSKNEEKIRLMEEQINDLVETIMAYAA